MRRQYIDSLDHPLYKSFRDLYEISFPIFEQRTELQQIRAFQNDKYRLLAFTEGDVFVGFICYWLFDTYGYIEHFAVTPEIRGRGFGSRILGSFIESTTGIVLLEIDPVIDEVSEARLRFYTRCGFYRNSYLHEHPAYRDGYRPHPLVVLTAKRRIMEKEYRDFCSDLRTVVMSS